MGVREHYLAVAEAILVEAGVEHVVYVNRQMRAYAALYESNEKRRYLVCPTPTTVKRLIALAHESGHIYLHGRGRSIPSYRMEYEAENFSYAALRRYGIDFDEKKELVGGQKYVARKMVMGRGNLKKLCRESFLWCQKYLRETKGGSEVLARVKSGEIKLVNLKRPDPSAPPKMRTRSLELTIYEPKSWTARKSSLGKLKGCTKRYIPSWTPAFGEIQHPKTRQNTTDRASFVDILRDAMASSGVSIYRISKETGIAHPVLYRIKNGGRENLRLDVAENLACYLGLTLGPGK